MKTKSKIISSQIIFILFSLTLLTVLCLVSKPSVYANQVFKPYVLKTGTQEDLFKHTNYKFESDGKQLYKLEIPTDGCLQIRMHVKRAGYINTEVYKNTSKNTLPTYLPCQCTIDNGNQGIIRQYIKKGTYYLCFPENSYDIDMLMYSSATRTIRDGSVVAAYCNADITDYFTYKSTKKGYLTLDQERIIDTAAAMSVSLNTSKNKKLTDVISDHAIDKQIIFPVEKGKTYKIGIKTLNIDGHQYYRLKVAFHVASKHAGSKKSNSKKIALKKNQSGIIFAEDSKKVNDWYKIYNNKDQKLNLVCSAFVTSGSIDISIYNKNMKKLGTYHLLPGKGDAITYKFKNINKRSIIPKGDYYIKVSKSRKSTAGIYNITLK